MSVNNVVTVPGPIVRDDLYEKVQDFICSLGGSINDGFAFHAGLTTHEDFAHDHECSTACVIHSRTVTPASSVTSVRSAGERLHSLIPPTNYGAVLPGSIYRSSYPLDKNYEFLVHLKIKTILTLVPERISPAYRAFMTRAGIQHFQVCIRANKSKVRVDTCEMSRALRLIMDRANHPILIHCNKGKHRTGCTVACFRRISGLHADAIREEYHTYAGTKARFLDEVFFENFDLNLVMWMARQEGWALPEMGTNLSRPPESVGRPMMAQSLA